MRQLNGVYTQLANRTHGRVGHVFQGRFKAILIDERQRSRLIRLDCDPMLLSAFWVHFDEGIDHADRADRCRYDRQR